MIHRNTSVFRAKRSTNLALLDVSILCNVMSHLVTLNGGYAPVNYDIAAKPSIDMISRRVWYNVYIGDTITQGNKRYTFKYINDNTVEFIPISDLKD